jgi:3-deoxy-D-manno-octulosonic-acid transferase
MSFLYNLLVFKATILLSMLALFNKKLKLFVDGRKETFLKIKALKNDKTIWIHAASLGEFEQAIPIIEILKKEYNQYKILVTFFSPSGYKFVKL